MDEQPPPPLPPHQPPPPLPRATPLLTPPPIIYNEPPRRSSSVVWKVLTFVFLALLCVSVFAHFLNFSRAITPRMRETTDRARSLEEVVIEQTNSDNKIAVIKVNGIISSEEVDRSSMNLVEFVSQQLKEAEQDSDVKAVILKVDSPGGEVMASDNINAAIRKFQDSCHKPVVCSMGSLAASGGYYISAPCRWIVANELTITGSIGVIMESWNYRHLMDKVGVRPQVFKSGRFKDMLSGEREPDSDQLTPAERKDREEENQMVQSFIMDNYNKFKEIVKTGRDHANTENAGQGRALASDWQNYADGRILSGKRALDLGLVDELGDFDVAVKRAEKLANISSASLVEYRVAFDFASVLSHLFGKTEVPALKVDLGMGAPPMLRAGQMYYILPTAVLH